MNKSIINSFLQLQAYVEQEEFKGWDPYDGLNSSFFQTVPLLNRSRLLRLIWIQTFKRCPFNLRKLFGVKKGYNAKGLALFLSGYCKWYQYHKSKEIKEKIHFLSAKLLQLQSQGWSGACWGYNFDWQARAFYQPKGTPSVVVTSFVGNALLDAYEITKNEKLLATVISIKDFILNDLHKTIDADGDICFSYSPLDKTQVFNASLLGSRILARIYAYTDNEELKNMARKSVLYCVKNQQKNGAWAYGTLPYHQWIDNFHTGFNLEAIADYQKYTQSNEFDEYLNKGLDYYLNTFFLDTGMPKYYNNKIYPVDIHCAAQLPVTLEAMGVLEEYKTLSERVLNWTIKNMQSSKGYFYYQKGKNKTIKIPYIRWSQAWIFKALSIYIHHKQEDEFIKTLNSSYEKEN